MLEISCATLTSKPLGALSPVPTAVPPSASSRSPSSDKSSICRSFSSELLQPEISCENLIGVASCKCVRPDFTTPSFSASSLRSVAVSLSTAGRTCSSMASTAAMCIAVGNVSLDDWDMLISSFGCRSFLPAISLPRLAMTSLAFMFDCVPEPVCQTTRGKCAKSFPSMTSVAACSMAASFSSVIFSGFSAWLALAAASFKTPKALVISRGMVSRPTPMGKFSWLRSVCAPQYLSAGTLTSPMESCSMR